MCIKKVIAFTNFNSFYCKYKPLTPYGLEHKDAMHFYCTHKELDEVHEITDVLIQFIHSDEHKALKTEHHLNRIDRLNSLNKSEFDTVDLHLIKKFLLNYRAITALLPQDIKTIIGHNSNHESLWNALSPNGETDESFYLSSAFSNELKLIREAIQLVNTHLSTLIKETLASIEEKYQLPFSGREFLLVSKTRTELQEAKELRCEFYDSHLMKVKPVFGKNYLNKQFEKEKLLLKETEAERDILTELSKLIVNEKQQLHQSIEAIRLLDTTLAKARLASQLKLTKPNYKASHLKVTEGFHYPLWETHQSKGLAYTPLNATFNSNTILLSGSNMGGKTVLFKTLAFLQLLTQLGFRIPATEFHTSVFSAIHVLGTTQANSIEGLSSFGEEIHQLTNALDSKESRLLFVDELAKTTNATEAKAILCAVLNFITKNKQLTGFFSTHFTKIPDMEGVSKHRMKGLNKESFEKHYQKESAAISDKIRLINAFMQYEVIADNDSKKSKDALSIAGILGLQPEILKDANNYLKKK
ncbi:MutS-related protein [Carboxylicivirga marina]|uniref:lysine 5,6-aminomutase reactivase ATPase KamC n=1 Tax=Carboxylicivirga marina TaxID=2800988 RepID=UPI002596361B|nr:hypothetical protein [uncultured Carboxylicivirga sp.]